MLLAEQNVCDSVGSVYMHYINPLAMFTFPVFTQYLCCTARKNLVIKQKFDLIVVYSINEKLLII